MDLDLNDLVDEGTADDVWGTVEDPVVWLSRCGRVRVVMEPRTFSVEQFGVDANGDSGWIWVAYGGALYLAVAHAHALCRRLKAEEDCCKSTAGGSPSRE